MGWNENSLAADEWGIRVGGVPNGALIHPYRSFPWSAVTELSGYTVPDDQETFVVVEIHHEDTAEDAVDIEEVLSDWEDFPAVVAGLSTKLPGLRPDWLDALSALSPTAGRLTVWSRAR